MKIKCVVGILISCVSFNSLGIYAQATPQCQQHVYFYLGIRHSNARIFVLDKSCIVRVTSAHK